MAHLVRQGLTVYLRPYWREQLVLAFSIIPSVALTTMAVAAGIRRSPG